ncbi:alanine racemase [Francisella sp. SYW-9]|uniref:alanine racemase n=1 Tax=Francisella sp. SYW-9 TaxID=2610888 RepID=UPI00123CAA57|nr:alanine racemase [Francisella sp. SYW-9]
MKNKAFTPYSPTKVIVDSRAFLKNLRIAQEKFDHTRIMAVLKSDAYGFGIHNLISTIKEATISYCGVTENSEIFTLREYGYEKNIMRVRTPSIYEVKDVLENFDRYKVVEEVIGNANLAIKVNHLAKQHNRVIPIHLNLNSIGMGRNGLDLSTVKGLKDLSTILSLENLKIIGIMSHFPCAGADNLDASRKGIRQFIKDANFVIKEGKFIRNNILLHAAATSASLKLSESHLDMVRLGSFIYGEKTEDQSPNELEPVLTFKSHVASKMFFPRGSTIGYNSLVTLNRDSILANITFGKVNGIPLDLQQVLIQGKRFNTIGSMSMNTTVVDITGYADSINENDEVVIVGKQEGVLGKDQITSQEIIDNAGQKSLSMLNYYISMVNHKFLE